MNENAKSFSSTCAKIGLTMLIFYAFFTLSTFAVSLWGTFWSKTMSDTSNLQAILNFWFAVVYFLSFSVPAFILRRMCKNLPNARPMYTSFKFNKWILCVIVVVVAINFTLSYLNNLLVTSFVPNTVTSITGTSINISGMTVSQIWGLFLVELLATAIVPALCEEYLFRGAVLTSLLPYGKSTAIFASAFLFGLMHQNPLQMLYTMLMGVIIGCVYVKTKSIWVCIILHAANNLITVLEQFVPILTGSQWITVLIDFVVVIVGGIALVAIMFYKDKEIVKEDEGSFGKIYDRGMEHEELVLDLPRGQKLRKFFTPTIIIFVSICAFNIIRSLLALYGISI